MNLMNVMLILEMSREYGQNSLFKLINFNAWKFPVRKNDWNLLTAPFAIECNETNEWKICLRTSIETIVQS